MPYQQVQRQHKITKLALPATPAILPVKMLTVMVDTKTFDLLSDQEIEVLKGIGPILTNRFLLNTAFNLTVRGIEEPVLVPLGARAILPLCLAQVAELVPASTCHMEATDREFDHVTAARAPFPAVLLC